MEPQSQRAAACCIFLAPCTDSTAFWGEKQPEWRYKGIYAVNFDLLLRFYNHFNKFCCRICAFFCRIQHALFFTATSEGAAAVRWILPLGGNSRRPPQSQSMGSLYHEAAHFQSLVSIKFYVFFLYSRWMMSPAFGFLVTLYIFYGWHHWTVIIYSTYKIAGGIHVYETEFAGNTE